MSKTLINIRIDRQGYKTKPTNFHGAIVNRIKESKNVQLDLNIVAKYIEKGHSHLFGHTKGTSMKVNDLYDINGFEIDVDNCYMEGDKEIFTNYQPQQVADFIYKEYKIKPAMIYLTYTGVNEKNLSFRFRLLYILETPVNGQEMALFYEHLTSNKNIPQGVIDKACKNPNRAYSGTCHPPEIYNNFIPLTTDIFNKCINEMKEKKQEKLIIKNRNAGETVVPKIMISENHEHFEIINNIDLQDLMNRLSVTPRIRSANSEYIAYEKCPVCGHSDCFRVYTNTNSFKCFSSNCITNGGKAINLYAGINRISTQEAFKELLDLYNLKESKKAYKGNLRVNKYITDDNAVSEELIKTIDDNNRVLITAPLGAGKTTFVKDKLYVYSKKLKKVLILVIPNVAQLKSLNKNDGIPVVFDHMIYENTDIVATTPDSLHKITDKLAKDEYIILCDEAHENITSYSYRPAYKNNKVGVAEKRAYKSIHMTATPETLIYNEYDKVITIDAKQKINNIIQPVFLNKKGIGSMVEYVKSLKDSGKTVCLFNNNKETNEIIKSYFAANEILTIDDSMKTVETLKAGSKGTVIDSIVKGIIPNNIKLLIFTSMIKAGIDIKEYSSNATLVINATEYTNRDDLIQLVGRFRNGIDVKLMLKESSNPITLDFKTSYKIRLQNSIRALRVAEKDPQMTEYIKGGYADEHCLYTDENGKININKQALSYNTYMQHCKNLYYDNDRLLHELRNQSAFNCKMLEPLKLEHIENEVAEMLKEKKEEIKQTIEECKEVIKKAPLKDIKVVIETPNNMMDIVAPKLVELKESYITIKKLDDNFSNLIKEFIKTYDITEAQAIKYYAIEKDKDIKETLKKHNMLKANEQIKKVGASKYLVTGTSKRALESKQAYIIKYLLPTIKQRNRITDKTLKALIISMINDSYIFGAKIKALKEGKIEDEKIKNKILNNELKKIKAITDILFIYKRDSNRISSVNTNYKIVVKEIKDKIHRFEPKVQKKIQQKQECFI